MYPLHHFIRFSFIAALAVAGAVSAQEAQINRYSLKRDMPLTGSHILKNYGVWVIPLDKPYSELTSEQKDMIRNQYEPMASADEPPFPAAGIQSLIRAFSKANDILQQEGKLWAVVTVGADGKARSVTIQAAPSTKFAEFAAHALMLEPYKAAVCDGRPCTMDFPLRVDLEWW